MARNSQALLFRFSGKKMFNRSSRPQFRVSPLITTTIAFTLFMTVSAVSHEQFGFEIAALAVIPVVGGSWYFGVRGGMLTTIFSILAIVILRVSSGHSYAETIANPGMVVGTVILVFIALVVGRLGTLTRERYDALIKLNEYEITRRKHTAFLELLNDITGKALEADTLDATLKILVKEIAKLFDADDCFFSFWDNARDVQNPAAAYGSMSDIYPYMSFEPEDVTLPVSAMKLGHPIAVTDMANSPYIDQKIALIFPSKSMLGLPLIVQDRKLGVLLLGYNRMRTFDEDIIAQTKITAEQVALVLSKSLLLEEERKQVKQLTALHDVALIASQVDNEDALIESVTDIIGKNLFPDNFGILLLDNENEILHPHPSYRFFSDEKIILTDVRLGEGITGQVALTRQPQCIGNVRRAGNYLDIDDRTVSELCVPILFKTQLLGVINAESTKKNAFDAHDERLLATLAGQLATAIEQIRKAQAERKWLDQLAHSNELTYSLAHITTHVEKALSQDEIIQTFGKELEKIGLTCILAVYDKSAEIFETKYTSLDLKQLKRLENRIGVPLIRYTFPLEHYTKLFSARENLHQPVVISNPADEVRLLFFQQQHKKFSKILEGVGVDQNAELFRLPLTFEENLLGILWVWGTSITRADLPVMSIFAKQIGISLERARLFTEVQELAFTDTLTGLNNRRSLFELGKIELSRAIRMKRDFCCMMLDLDHFKLVNDNHGHLVGDQVLHEFAGRARSSIRDVDLIGRYGGEELIILLPETDLKTAKLVAERLRKRVAETPIMISNTEIFATVSIGVAGRDENTSDLETLIARADQAMYIAKHKGRNCVAVSV